MYARYKYSRQREGIFHSEKSGQKSIFAKIAWFAQDLFTSGSSDLHKGFCKVSGLRRGEGNSLPSLSTSALFRLVVFSNQELGRWLGSRSVHREAAPLCPAAPPPPLTVSARGWLAPSLLPFPPSATSGTRRRVNPSEGVERNSSHVPPVTIEPN